MLRSTVKSATVYKRFFRNLNAFPIRQSRLAIPHRNLETSTSNLPIDGPDASFALGSFGGRIHSQQLFPFPDALDEESKETIKLMIDPFEKFFREVHDPAQSDLDEAISQKSIDGLKELGGMGLQVPQKYGGMELKNTQYGRLCEIIATYDLSIGIFMGAHQSIGYKGILLYGNEKQKEKYLPSLVSGDKLAAFCLTEPSSGSDANSIQTKAVLDSDGKHYILNGNKIWISNGGLADVMTVFAQVPFQSSDSEKVSQRVTAFIVERDFGGVTNGPPEKKMGIRSSNTASVYFDNVKVPVENVLGKVGDGFKVAMNILNNGRFGMGAGMSGLIRMLIAKSIEHANNRVQFRRKLIEYQSIQEKIAKMAITHYAVESVAYAVSNNMDRGIKEYQVEAAISKVLGSESGWNTCDECLQILGGIGYMREANIERFMRDLRIFRIFEGTNDILRLFIALNGVQYAGNHLKELQKAMKEPISNFGTLWDQGIKRSRQFIGISNNEELIENAAPQLRDSASKITQRIEEFGVTVEKLLLKYGKQIVDEQFLLTRLADASIDVYTMAAVLARATKAIKENLPTAEHEQLLATTFIDEASDRTERNLGSVIGKRNLRNFSSYSQIASQISQQEGIATTRPLGF
ncbi:uncharacterized protein TRIADDRAFT_20833 [Trichoplax adhaerens]|uniref:Very long-chain specific acyl-CoA dehydrogenase, mitochondrial n=1 Tax=Trichoplax adhaerens TaxID=10228 RepID=B3RN56_TRIAD|nr:hypothetical protein TRIADDRAFT_20833 [Trichoplax adhaerens]EDV27397.1 hypothetical protein TRIADDRAFT_20833 [Trichoplax adhaerens]|eukprot:XP_002109231.1 hypothetical protein TRIADDRAFT_20833 [Trichoplax adhaerens]